MQARRSWVAILVAAAACEHGRPPAGPPPDTTPLVELAAHHGATELFGGDPLLLSYEQDSEKLGTLRLSAGQGAVARTLDGWPLGVAGDRAYVAVPEGNEVRILRVALTGEPEELARVPAPPPYHGVRGAVTGDGHVAVATDDGAVQIIAPDRTARTFTALPAGLAPGTLAGNPEGPELAILASATGPRAAGVPPAAIVLVDATTGAVRWTAPLEYSLSAIEGETGFVAGKLALHLRDGIAGFDLATGARRELVHAEYVNARTLAIARSGDTFAYVHWVHPSDIMPLSMDQACQVYVVHAGAPEPSGPRRSYGNGCYFGAGLLFVGGALWVAPP